MFSGVHFKKALFVPNTSVHYKVNPSNSPTSSPWVDVSWQLTLQRAWESIIRGGKGKHGYVIIGCDVIYVADILEHHVYEISLRLE